jgi:hypothetical protein
MRTCRYGTEQAAAAASLAVRDESSDDAAVERRLALTASVVSEVGASVALPGGMVRVCVCVFVLSVIGCVTQSGDGRGVSALFALLSAAVAHDSSTTTSGGVLVHSFELPSEHRWLAPAGTASLYSGSARLCECDQVLTRCVSAIFVVRVARVGLYSRRTARIGT